MKLVIIGGGGVRAPLVMPALARRQDQLGLSELVLVDTNEEKLGLIAPIARYAAQRHGAHFEITATTDAREALPGADAVITTIRPGGDEGRVRDEKIALEHGVLGQETTGFGGFAMALRTVPAISEYARLMRELAPDAWLLNFTNPAGLVVQAITQEFPDLKIAGICDTPSGLHREVAHVFGRQSHDVPVRLFGLNHLSWMTEALVDGENVVPRIIADPALRTRMSELGLFDPGLLSMVGFLPNEYLYFYYYRDRARERISAAAETRGQQIARLGSALIDDLREIHPAEHPERGWERYRAYIAERHGTYLAMETGEQRQREEGPPQQEGEGYAGVALDILTAQGTDMRVIANVPNQGAIPGLRDDDVVEVSCQVSQDGLNPIQMDQVPDDEFALMLEVKQYERRTVEAIRQHSRKAAVEALVDHPLVGSYPVAVGLVDAYLQSGGTDGWA